MGLKIFTPSHGIFMDSLIMYGLVSAFYLSDAEYRVSGTAGIFKLEVEGVSLGEVANLIANNIKDNKEAIVEHLINRLRVVQKGSQKRLESYLNSNSSPEVVAKNLERSYMSPGHAQQEGRYHKGQHVWLPFYPHIGKYFTGEYTYPPISYSVCPSCIAFASLGFYKAAIPIPHIIRKNASHVILLSFEGEVYGKILAEILRFINSDDFILVVNRLRFATEKIPLNTFTYILLTQLTSNTIRSLYESNATWVALSTTFDVVRGQVVQIRGYEEASIDRYLSSLVHLMKMDEKYNINPLEKLRSVTEKLVRKGETAAVEALYRFMNTRSYPDLYTATRQIVKTLGEGFGKSFCEELICLIQST